MCRPTPKQILQNVFPIIILFLLPSGYLPDSGSLYMILADQRYDDRMLFENA